MGWLDREDLETYEWNWLTYDEMDWDDKVIELEDYLKTHHGDCENMTWKMEMAVNDICGDIPHYYGDEWNYSIDYSIEDGFYIPEDRFALPGELSNLQISEMVDDYNQYSYPTFVRDKFFELFEPFFDISEDDEEDEETAFEAAEAYYELIMSVIDYLNDNHDTLEAEFKKYIYQEHWIFDPGNDYYSPQSVEDWVEQCVDIGAFREAEDLLDKFRYVYDLDKNDDYYTYYQGVPLADIYA